MYKDASERTNRCSVQPAVASRFAPIRPGCGEGVISDTTIARQTKTIYYLCTAQRNPQVTYSSGSARLKKEERDTKEEQRV